MSEFGFIAAVKEMFSSIPLTGGMEGIGDDCAVMPLGDGRAMVVTTDMLVEGTHFLRRAATASQIGRKALSVNLSDVAAMGANPVAALLSIGLPEDCTGQWACDFMRGMHDVAQRFGVALIGGDTTLSATGVVINITAFGTAPLGNIKRRSAARPGDYIAVAGRLGDSSAGLERVLAGDYASPLSAIHHDPQPQVPEGIWLGARSEVHAMIDISDGLASDLAHILEESGVGACVELDDIPTDHSLHHALEGGEDYKLLFTFAASDPELFAGEYRRLHGGLYIIGRIAEGEPRITWLRHGLPVEGSWRGYTHF